MLGSLHTLGGTPLQAAAQRQHKQSQNSRRPLRVVADVEAYPETRNRPKVRRTNCACCNDATAGTQTQGAITECIVRNRIVHHREHTPCQTNRAAALQAGVPEGTPTNVALVSQMCIFRVLSG